ncbi:MAG: TolB family protein [Candidatus Dormibacteria bacterium]
MDPELLEVARATRGRLDEGVLETATMLRLELRANPGPQPDPDFRARLRADLGREAKSRGGEVRSRRRGLALPLSATVGVAALAVLTLVVTSLVTRPGTVRAVQVHATLAGQHQVSVTKPIQIKFNQKMDEAAVLTGLRISPAVSYQASWPNPKTLVISPVHGLAPNVGYVVTIAKPAAKGQNGAQPTAAVVIPFGTGAAPTTPTGRVPKVVSVTDVASTQGVTSLSYTADGALLMLSSGPPPVLAASSPSPSPTSSPSPSAPADGPPTTGSPQPGTVYVLTPKLTELASNAFGAVSSPDSQDVAFWTPGADGALDLDVVPTSGGAPQKLASTAETDPGLAWLDNGNLLYPAAGQLREVSLAGQVSQVDSEVELGPTGFFSLSPTGSGLFSSPGGVPTVYSLTDGTATTISDLVGLPAWTPAGSGLAYVTSSSGVDSIELSGDLGASSTTLETAPGGATLSDLTFDPSGTYLAYVLAPGGQQSQLEALDVESHSSGQLGTLTSVADPVWSPSGGQLTTLSAAPLSDSQTVDTLLLSGTPPTSSSDQGAAATALASASALAELQVADGPSALSAIAELLAPGTERPVSVLLPGKFDRFYSVSSTASSAGSTTYQVVVRLVRDATSSAPPAFLPELVTVQTAGTSPEILNIVPGLLTPVPTGPQVLSVVSNNSSDGTTIVAIQFDSDLNPKSIGPQSITISVGGHLIGGAQFDYSALTRTVTATVSQLPLGAVTLTVNAPLSDIDGTPIQTPYQVVLQPQGPTSSGS